MKCARVVIAIFVIFAPFVSLAAEVTSVRPESVAPGDNLYVSFSDAEPPIFMLLEGHRLEAVEINPDLYYFPVPSIEAGSYPLRFQVGDKLITTSIQLQVAEPVPRILSLAPSNIPECATPEERQVEISGENFILGSRLFINGLIVSSRVVDLSRIIFNVPVLNSGVYGIQIVNPSGNKSLPHSLYIDSVPKIESVSIGNEFATYYELVVKGENFYSQSSLLINDFTSIPDGIPPRQKVIFGQARRNRHDGFGNQAQADYLYFKDCRTLIYYRFPLSTQKGEMTLRVINPDGKTTEAFQLLAY
jgi:hypothetical protein